MFLSSNVIRISAVWEVPTAWDGIPLDLIVRKLSDFQKQRNLIILYFEQIKGD